MASRERVRHGGNAHGYGEGRAQVRGGCDRVRRGCDWIRGGGAYGCGGKAHTAYWGHIQLWREARTGKARARMGGEGGTHGSEGGCARVMGRVRKGGNGDAHDGSLHQF
jgi:hypothetical protein